MSPDSTVNVAGVRAGRRRDGGWVSSPAPALSWLTETDRPGWRQASAEIEVDGVARRLDGDASVLVDWPFPPLRPRQVARVRVRVTGEDGSISGWSDACVVSAGHLEADGWRGRLIGAAAPTTEAQPVLLRHDFTVDTEIERAVFYGTARGVYCAELNGVVIDDSELNPGWTSYQHRLSYDVVDVTRLIGRGLNSIVVDLAGGWYTERYGFEGRERRVYGDQPSFAGQLVLELADGEVRVIATGSDWSATTEGPRVASGIYPGEHVDARRSVPDRLDPAWSPVRSEPCEPTPQPRSSEPVRKTAELQPVSIVTTPSGRTVLDFGQNMVGRLRIRVRGEAGRVVTLRHAEVLEHGELGVRPLRAAAATDSYTLRGEGTEEWEPRFTFHGFRYAEIDGWPGELDLADVTAVVVHSDMERTGWFETSHPLLDRLHENVVWGMRGNFLSIPTDCPQRDERLGWTGDIQVFAPTASYLYDCDAFLASWLEDLAGEQVALDGIVPFVVPDVLRESPTGAAAWGDAATVVPTVLFERFGDLELLRRQYPSMRGWADAIARLSGPELRWEGRFQFGDWLDPDAPADDPARAKTDPDLVATAYLYRSTRLVADAARLLELASDADEYAARAERIREAFVAAYVTSGGRMTSDAPTAYALALQFDLAPERLRSVMADRLAWLVRAAGFQMSTGFVGTPLILDALLAGGHDDVAGRLLLQTRNPSWLYAVTMGATTIWERWDSMLEDGTINPGSMTSFNHYAFGAVADWMHRTLGGLAPAEPGYRRLRIAPRPIEGVDRVATRHLTPYGLASVEWTTSADSGFELQVAVPPNTSAEIVLPDGARHEVGSGPHRFRARLARRERRAMSSFDLDRPLAGVADDPEAFAALTAVATTADPTGRWLGRRTRWVPQRSLREELIGAPTEVVAAVESELARLAGGVAT